MYDDFVDNLNKKFPFGVTYSDKCDSHFEYLGMIMDFSDKGKCHLTMKGYIESTMNEWKIAGKREFPHIEELFKVNESTETLTDEKHKSFRRRVGKLIYLATRRRPDVLCSVIFLSTRVQEPLKTIGTN